MKNEKISKQDGDAQAFSFFGGVGMTASVSIREDGKGWSTEISVPIQDDKQHLATTSGLEPLLAHIDRGGLHLRRQKIWQEVVGVLDAVNISDYGIFALFGRSACLVPDEFESKLRSLQGQRIAILRYSENGYSVRAVV